MPEVMPLPAEAAASPPTVERACDLDLTPVVERVMRTMGESVTRDQVLNLLRGLLQREFAEARVLVYLPVLLQRRACDCLRNAAAAPDADLQQRA